MDKRLMLLGIMMIISGFLITGLSYNPSSYISSSSQTVSLAPNALVYSAVKLNATGFISIVYSSSPSPINFYLMNQSAFSAIRPYIDSEYLPASTVRSLEGKGLLFEVDNSTSGIFPYNISYNSIGYKAPSYLSGNSLILQGGIYYLVYQNPGAGYSNTTYKYVVPAAGLLPGNGSSPSGISLTGTFSALLVLAGVVLAVLSLIRSGKEGKSSAETDEKIARIYMHIEKKRRNYGAGRRRKGGGGRAKGKK